MQIPHSLEKAILRHLWQKLVADDPEDLVDGAEGGQGPVGGQGVGADRLGAEEPHLLERGRQARGRGREAPVDIAGGQDVDLGGQVGQIGVGGSWSASARRSASG